MMSGNGPPQTGKPNGAAGAVESAVVSEGKNRTRKPRPAIPPDEAEFVTLKQAAAKLQVSPATLQRLYYREEIEAVLVRHCLRIRRSSLEAYLARRRWSPALCAAETARPRAGRRLRRQTTASPSPASEVMNQDGDR